jgi:hypothetical protein
VRPGTESVWVESHQQVAAEREAIRHRRAFSWISTGGYQAWLKLQDLRRQALDRITVDRATWEAVQARRPRSTYPRRGW